MSPITHYLVGWVAANSSSKIDKRERAWITLSGVAADLDGLGIVPELLTRNSSHPLTWWSDYHHVLGHNLLFGLLLVILSALFSTRRFLTGTLVVISFHLHLLGDLIGSRGPDGYQWPIKYLYPFSKDWELVWSGQWALNAWPNFVITGGLVFLTFMLARNRGYSPLEIISDRADKAFVETLRQRFPLVDRNGIK
jgi:inner membrane protein